MISIGRVQRSKPTTGCPAVVRVRNDGVVVVLDGVERPLVGTQFLVGEWTSCRTDAARTLGETTPADAILHAANSMRRCTGTAFPFALTVGCLRNGGRQTC